MHRFLAPPCSFDNDAAASEIIHVHKDHDAPQTNLISLLYLDHQKKESLPHAYKSGFGRFGRILLHAI